MRLRPVLTSWKCSQINNAEVVRSSHPAPRAPNTVVGDILLNSGYITIHNMNAF